MDFATKHFDLVPSLGKIGIWIRVQENKCLSQIKIVYLQGSKPKIRGGGWEELRHAPTPEAKGSGREEQLHVQEAAAAWAQEGLEELSHVEGQEGQRWGDTPRPR